MTEKITRTLQELASEFGIQNLDQFIQSAWQSSDSTDAEIVAELIERTVEDLLDQHFLWLHIVESEDCERLIPDGWYNFITVHPESRLCVTFQDTVPWKDIGFRVRIRTLQDAINAVITLTELIKQNLQKGGMNYGENRA